MALHALRVYIYERAAGPDYPVVEHVFYGRTRAEAERYYGSHLETDEFLRDCVERGRWRQVDCWAELEWTRESAPRARTRPLG